MAKKKSKMSLGQALLTFIAMILALAICIPLFINVWSMITTTPTFGGGTTTTATEMGGYFTDYSVTEAVFNFNTNNAVFASWANTIAGIALIVALVGAVIYILGAIMNIVTKGNKTAVLLAKLGSIVMLIAGMVILVTSILFALPVAEFTGAVSTSVSLGLGAWIGILAPIGAGILGLLSSKN